jgi:hypothetical protein
MSDVTESASGRIAGVLPAEGSDIERREETA